MLDSRSGLVIRRNSVVVFRLVTSLEDQLLKQGHLHAGKARAHLHVNGGVCGWSLIKQYQGWRRALRVEKCQEECKGIGRLGVGLQSLQCHREYADAKD